MKNQLSPGRIIRRTIAYLMTTSIIASSAAPMGLAAGVELISTPPPQMPATVRRGSKVVQLHSSTLVFSENPSDAEITAARVFSEPLIPLADPHMPADNKALANALLDFKARGNAEDISALTGFIASYPGPHDGALHWSSISASVDLRQVILATLSPFGNQLGNWQSLRRVFSRNL